jgi:octanoyl-[GcvH]:protein N-octanoyltransferase
MRESANARSGIGEAPFFYGIDREYAEITDAFLVDEWIAHRIAKGEWDRPVIHLWTHRSALVLGMKERWLPTAQQACERLTSREVQHLFRTSGGAAVPLDVGVLNVSMIWPAWTGEMRLHEDFQKFIEWICWMSGTIIEMNGYGEARMPIDYVQGEVKGAYCPGSYDLSLGGKKICGLAQRRPLRSRIWQAYINVTGSGSARAASVAAWYGAAGADGLAEAIRPEQSGSLADFYPIAGDAAKWRQSIFESLSGRVTKLNHLLTNDHDEAEWLQWQTKQMARFRHS